MRGCVVAVLAMLTPAIAGCDRHHGRVAPPNPSPEIATKRLVDQLAAELLRRIARFESEIEAALQVEAYLEVARGQGSGKDDPFEDEHVSRRRARVLARLDAQRSAFPQLFCEMMPQERFAEGARSGVALSDVRSSDLPGATADVFQSLPTGTAPVLSPHAVFDALLATFRKNAHAADVAATGSFYPAAHDPATESSECLYLILTEPLLGESFVDQISEQFIRDSDGDGLPEFVDAFGQPLRYYRWPTDYYAFLIDVTGQLESDYSNALGSKGRYESQQYSRTLTSEGLGDEALLYSTNWFNPRPLGRWHVDKGLLRQHNGRAWEVLTYRRHQLYDVRADGRNLELFLYEPSGFAIDFGFGFSCKKIYRSESLEDFPRWYPRRPLVMSAGADGRLGLYQPQPDNPRGDRPASRSSRLPMWAGLQIDYRCGRVDARYWEAVLDNIVSIDLGTLPSLDQLRVRLKR